MYNSPFMPPAPWGGGGYMNQIQQSAQQTPPQIPASPRVEIVRVTGLDGAKAYQMPANSAAALFDAEQDVFYLKSTDGAGFPTIKAFDYSPHVAEQPASQQTYVTRQEFDALKEAFEREQQRVSGPSRRGKQPDEQ